MALLHASRAGMLQSAALEARVPFLHVLNPARGGLHAQVVLSWADEGGATVHRVVTRRLQVTSVAASYARDVDVRLSSLLLAKGVVQDALRAQAAGNEDLSGMQRVIGAADCVPCCPPHVVLLHLPP